MSGQVEAGTPDADRASEVGTDSGSPDDEPHPASCHLAFLSHDPLKAVRQTLYFGLRS